MRRHDAFIKAEWQTKLYQTKNATVTETAYWAGFLSISTIQVGFITGYNEITALRLFLDLNLFLETLQDLTAPLCQPGRKLYLADERKELYPQKFPILNSNRKKDL